MRLAPLILQPLVENALKHGLAQKSSNCKLKIQVYQDDDQVCINVSDNGTGISKKRLGEIRDEDEGVTGIGLMNVMSRIKFIYGTDLDIVTEEGIGTTITVHIPGNRLKQGKENP